MTLMRRSQQVVVKGETVFIPRISVSSNNLPFQFKMLQFRNDYYQITKADFTHSRHRFKKSMIFSWTVESSELIIRSNGGTDDAVSDKYMCECFCVYKNKTKMSIVYLALNL